MRQHLRLGSRPQALIQGAFISAAAILWLCGSTSPISAQATGQEAGGEFIELNDSASRDLSSEQAHRYRINLRAGDFTRVGVEASGIGLRATVTDDDERVQAQTPCIRVEPAHLSWIADRQRAYRVEISACEKEQVTGSYRVRVEERRSANARDPDRVAADAAIMKAGRLRAEGVSDSSREALNEYEKAQRLWHATNNLSDEAAALRKIGEIHQGFGERSSALSAFQKALASARDLRERIKVLNDLCSLRMEMGKHREALATCSTALDLSRASNNSAGEAQALSNMGMAYYWLGDFRKALEYQKAALDLWRDLRDKDGQAQAFLMTGYADVIVGEIQNALASYQQALSFFRASDNYQGQALVLAALGNLHAVSSGKQDAIDYYNQALPLAQQLKNSEVNAEAYSGMGFVYYQMGDLEKALQYREQALELYKAMPDLWGECSLHMSVGRVYHAMGAEQQALDHYWKGLAIARSMPNAHLESALLREMGAVYDRLGESRKALEQYKQSLSLSRRGGDPRDEADALNQMGGVYAKLGDEQKALDYFNRALPLTRSVTDRVAEAQTLSNIAQARRDLGDLDAAKAQIEAALDIIESLRTSVASYNLRSSYFATVRHHYDLYIDVLMQLDKARPGQGFAAAAFEVSERARARTLLETLKEAGADIRQGADPVLVERERTLQQALNAKAERRMQLLASGQKDEAAAVTKELDDLTTQYDEVSAHIRANSPRYAALTQPRPLGLGDVQRQLLDDDTLLVEYALGDERSYMWAVTRTEAFSYELPARKEIERTTRTFYEALTAEQPRPGESYEERRARSAQAEEQLEGLSASLSDMLLGPAAAHLGKKRLLMIPDGALQYIPFQALAAPAKSGDGTARRNLLPEEPERLPLIFEHEITNEPSASTLALLLGETARRLPAPNLVAVFADPVFESDDPRIRLDGKRNAPVAPGTGGELVRALRDAGATGPGGKIPRLLASHDEAEAIMAFVPSGTGLRSVGFDASRATAIRPEIGGYRIVHFATHGLLDNEHPELSGLVLSLFDPEGQPQDGFLRLHDIYNLNLPADLVVLSACNTGLGKDMRGEGMIGLTRGFMYAGAASVMASLWKVDDEATAELMKLFYGFMLRDGLPPAAALRQAQLTMWKQKRWHAPYYWAAFVIQGQYAGREDLSRYKGSVAGWLVPAGGGAVSLFLVAFYAMRWRRKRVI